MLKMLLDANGGIVLTNDGHAILREIDVSHPAAKVRQSRHVEKHVLDAQLCIRIAISLSEPRLL